jgi:hypothetical protein
MLEISERKVSEFFPKREKNQARIVPISRFLILFRAFGVIRA